MIDGKNVFDQLVKSSARTYDSILKITTGQWDDYTTGCLLNYNCFNNNYKMIAIDISKQEPLDDDPKAIQKFNFTGNLDWAAGARMFFIIKETKETTLHFSQGTGKVLWICSTILFSNNIISI